MKKILLIVMGMVLALPSLFAESIKLRFEGDAWDQVYVANANEYASDYEVYFHPDTKTLTYEFTMPFNSESNTPGLEFGVVAGYKLNVSIVDGEDLKQGPDYDNNDYYLTDGSDSSWSPYSRVAALDDEQETPTFSKGWSLSLYSKKMDGATFVVTTVTNDSNITFEFLTYGPMMKDGVDVPVYELFDGYVLYPEANPMNRTSGETSEEFMIEYERPVVLQLSHNDDITYDIKVVCPGLEEGPETYRYETTTGLLGGNVLRIYLYEGAMKHKFYIQVAAPGFEIPEIEAEPEPGIELPKITANPANGSILTDYFYGAAIRWGEYTLQIVDPKGFSVTCNGKDITNNGVFDFEMKLTEYDPDEQTSLENVQLQIVDSGIKMGQDEPGTYVVTINEGAVSILVGNAIVPCPKVVLTYTLELSQSSTLPTPVVNPAEGTVEELQTVTVTWPGLELFRRTNPTGTSEDDYLHQVTMTVNGGEPQNVKVTTEKEGLIYYREVVLDINATESGEYEITIPEGTFFLFSEDIGSVENEELVLKYTVNLPQQEEPVYLPAAVTTPADGALVGAFSGFTATWEGVEFDLGVDLGEAVELPLEGVEIYLDGELQDMEEARLVAANVADSDDEGGIGVMADIVNGTMILTPSFDAFFWKGEVEVVIPAGLVKSITGAVNPEVKVSFTVATEAYGIEWTPDMENANFKAGEGEIIATWTEGAVTSLVENPEVPIFVQTTDENGDLSGQIYIDEFVSIQDGSLLIDVSDFEIGRYLLTIPSGTVVIADGEYINGESYYEFVISNSSAVSSLVENADGIWIVYDLNGVKVLATEKAEELKGLAPGVYVINGKTTLIK